MKEVSEWENPREKIKAEEKIRALKDVLLAKVLGERTLLHHKITMHRDYCENDWTNEENYRRVDETMVSGEKQLELLKKESFATQRSTRACHSRFAIDENSIHWYCSGATLGRRYSLYA